MQVCLGGHVITAMYNERPDSRKDYCRECGKATIHRCQSCQKEITGTNYDVGFEDLSKPPAACDGCGAIFPWAAAPAHSGVQPPQSALELDLLIERLKRFPHAAQSLTRRRSGSASLTIVDEYDVQDVLRAFLGFCYNEVRSEEPTESNAGGGARIDFVLSELQIAVEAKMMRASLTDAKLGEEMLADVGRYSKHTRCKAVVFHIYDPQRLIKHPVSLKKDVEGKKQHLSKFES